MYFSTPYTTTNPLHLTAFRTEMEKYKYKTKINYSGIHYKQPLL